jgi:hypothetical protein
VTTYLTWRLVFAGEVVVVIVILSLMGWIGDAPQEGRRPQLDLVGAALSALGPRWWCWGAAEQQLGMAAAA